MARYANVNNYLAAARAGSQGLLDSLAAIQATSPDLASLAEQSFKNQASEEVLAMNLSGKSVENAIRNRAQLDLASLEAKELEYEEEARRDTVRKAGRLAARAERLRNSTMPPELKRPEIPELEVPFIKPGPQPMTDDEHAFYQRRIDEAGKLSPDEELSIQEEELADLEQLNVLIKQRDRLSPKSSSTSPAPAVQPLSSVTPTSSNQSFILSQIQGSPDVVSKLVSSEALRRSDDEYGVIANALLRVKSPEFANDLSSVVYDKGVDGKTIQYTGVWGPNAVVDDQLIKKLSSAEGVQKIDQAMTKLGGRLFFKASDHDDTRFGYRPDTDIMFAPGGNYYHD
jgi:hypothetical protein